MSNRSGSPLFVTINVTTACNLSCAYCFMQPRSGDYMSPDDFDRVTLELAKLSLFFINISGGEPFVHPEIADFLEIAHDRFRHVMTLTNGTFLKPKHLAAIQRIISRKGNFTAQVSLDAALPAVNDATRGMGEKVLRNIRVLRNLGVDLIIAIVITRHNLDFVEDTIRQLAGVARHFHLMTVQDVRSVQGIKAGYQFARSREEEFTFWHKINKLEEECGVAINTPLKYEGDRGCATGAPCMAAFSHLVIDPNLIVRPCDRLTDVVVGDLRETSLLDVWHGERARKILQSPLPYCRSARKPEVVH